MSIKVGSLPLAIFVVLMAILLLITACVFCMLKDRIFGKKEEQISDIGKRGQELWLAKDDTDVEGSRPTSS